MHIEFQENIPNVAGVGPDWLFDIDRILESMNYVSVNAGTNTNNTAGSKVNVKTGETSMEQEAEKDHILMPILETSSFFDSSSKNDDPPSSSDADKEKNAGNDNGMGVQES